MKKIMTAVVFFLALVGGCNGGGGHHDSPPPADDPSTPPVEDDNPPPQIPPPTTSVGTPQGEAVSAVIGAAGGQLESADGSVTLQVPAGAFATDTTVSMQPISNEAESLGSIGTAFRIQPEDLHSNVPMTLSFHADAAALQGTALSFVSVGYQDGAGHWRVIENPQYDHDTDTVSVQTSHFSDWSMVTGVQLRPSSATVKTGTSKELQIRFCTQIEYTVPNEDDDLVPTLYGCTETQDVTYGVGNWSVNGVTGGSKGSGTITPDADSATNKATFTAPASVPAGNPVAVSVEVLDPENPGEFTVLVSNITIVEDVSCETLKKVEFIEASAAFDRYNWIASSENQRYEGQQSGRLAATMTNQIVPAARDKSPIGYWTSQGAPHTGLVTMNDKRELFYDDETVVETAIGNGLPYVGIDATSFISLIVNYETCQYELAASFVVLGTVTSGGETLETPIIPGGIYYRETVPAEFLQGQTLTRDVPLPAREDIEEKLNGYYPAGQSSELKAQGGTTGHWQLSIFSG